MLQKRKSNHVPFRHLNLSSQVKMLSNYGNLVGKKDDLSFITIPTEIYRRLMNRSITIVNLHEAQEELIKITERAEQVNNYFNNVSDMAEEINSSNQKAIAQRELFHTANFNALLKGSKKLSFLNKLKLIASWFIQ